MLGVRHPSSSPKRMCKFAMNHSLISVQCTETAPPHGRSCALAIRVDCWPPPCFTMPCFGKKKARDHKNIDQICGCEPTPRSGCWGRSGRALKLVAPHGEWLKKKKLREHARELRSTGLPGPPQLLMLTAHAHPQRGALLQCAVCGSEQCGGPGALGSR